VLTLWKILIGAIQAFIFTRAFGLLNVAFFEVFVAVSAAAVFAQLFALHHLKIFRSRFEGVVAMIA